MTDSEKKRLSRFVFPQLDRSELELVWSEIHLCFSNSPDHRLTWSQLHRGNYWLKMNGFETGPVPVRIAEN